jgi:hypothetical protein
MPGKVFVHVPVQHVHELDWFASSPITMTDIQATRFWDGLQRSSKSFEKLRPSPVLTIIGTVASRNQLFILSSCGEPGLQIVFQGSSVVKSARNDPNDSIRDL